jgi:hypothetical protein
MLAATPGGEVRSRRLSRVGRPFSLGQDADGRSRVSEHGRSVLQVIVGVARDWGAVGRCHQTRSAAGSPGRARPTAAPASQSATASCGSLNTSGRARRRSRLGPCFHAVSGLQLREGWGQSGLAHAACSPVPGACVAGRSWMAGFVRERRLWMRLLGVAAALGRHEHPRCGTAPRRVAMGAVFPVKGVGSM